MTPNEARKRIEKIEESVTTPAQRAEIDRVIEETREDRPGSDPCVQHLGGEEFRILWIKHCEKPRTAGLSNHSPDYERLARLDRIDAEKRAQEAAQDPDNVA